MIPTGFRYDNYYQDFELVGSPGIKVRLDLSSRTFDAYLVVIDRETGGVLLENDDSGPGTDSLLVITLQAGHSYVLRVPTALERETGAFVLTTTMAGSATITPPRNSYGTFDTGDRQDPRYPDVYYMEEYELTGVNPGQIIGLDMVSEEVDALLTLLDKTTSQVLAENDDYGEYTDSRLIFTVPASLQYLIRATTVYSKETGNYRLSAHVLETVTVPSQITRTLCPGSTGILPPITRMNAELAWVKCR